MCNSLSDFAFKRNINDLSLFVRVKNGSIVILFVCVDDIYLIGDSIAEIESVKSFLKSLFLLNILES